MYFFLEGIYYTANDVVDTLLSISSPFSQNTNKIKTLGRATLSALAVFATFQKKPILTISELVGSTNLSKPTVIKSVNHLMDLKIITKNSEKKWGQIYAYKAYVDLLTSEEDLK